MLKITGADMQVLITAIEREITEGGPLDTIYALQDVLNVGENILTMEQLDELDGVVNREMESIDESDDVERDTIAYDILLDLYDAINEYRELLYSL